eukprot:Opistho-2@23486
MISTVCARPRSVIARVPRVLASALVCHHQRGYAAPAQAPPASTKLTLTATKLTPERSAAAEPVKEYTDVRLSYAYSKKATAFVVFHPVKLPPATGRILGRYDLTNTLTTAQIIEARRLRIEGNASVHQLAKKYNVRPEVIMKYVSMRRAEADRDYRERKKLALEEANKKSA